MGEKAVITIERMMKEDIDQVLAIEQESFSQPWSRNLFLSEFRSTAVSTLLVARLEEHGVRRIVGYIVYWIVADEMHVLNLAVAPAYRRHGIAQNLVLNAIKRAFKKGAKRSFLEVRASNTAARKLYSNLGFTGSSIRRNYYEAPLEDALVMILEEGMFQSLATKEK